jgi:hypothetical protein
MTDTNPLSSAKMESVVTPRLERQKIPSKSEEMVSILLNRHLFYFTDSLIINDPQNAETPFLLLVVHNNKVFAKQAYTSIRGAKIAFARQFLKRSHKKNLRPEWSYFYIPEQKWLAEKIEKINRENKENQ